MRLNDLRDNPGATRTRKRIGRGIGSGKGKTGGRGGKGQTARSGVSVLSFEGGQMPLYRRLPKRGFNNPFRRDFTELNLGMLQAAIDSGRVDSAKEITEVSLLDAGVVGKRRDGIKLLGKGELKAKVSIAVTAASKSAQDAIAKLGGSVVLPAPKAKVPTRGRKVKRAQAEIEEKARKAKEAEAAAMKAKEKGKDKPKGEAKAKEKPVRQKGKDQE